MERTVETLIEEKEGCLHTFLIKQLSEELKGSEDYQKYAVKAKKVGDHPLATLFHSHAKEELRHFAELFDAIEKNIPNIKANPLYPLLEELEEWAEDIEAEINLFR